MPVEKDSVPVARCLCFDLELRWRLSGTRGLSLICTPSQPDGKRFTLRCVTREVPQERSPADWEEKEPHRQGLLAQEES